MPNYPPDPTGWPGPTKPHPQPCVDAEVETDGCEPAVSDTDTDDNDDEDDNDDAA